MGRPVKYTENKLKELLDSFYDYIEKTDIPIVAEFAYLNGFSRQRLYEFNDKLEGFSDAIKLCITKKEAQLEKKALGNEINNTMAIFSLKQLGWTDKAEVSHDIKYTVIPAKIDDADD